MIKNELAGKHQVIRAIAEDGSTPWPEKFPLVWLEERRRQMGSADRPFVFLVRHRASGVILFVGRMVHPEQVA